MVMAVLWEQEKRIERRRKQLADEPRDEGVLDDTR
jgi:hypothetical protein